MITDCCENVGASVVCGTLSQEQSIITGNQDWVPGTQISEGNRTVSNYILDDCKHQK